jgi:DNA repair exonuclease SbcCD ATPase subunit
MLPFVQGMRVTTGKAPPRTVMQARLHPFVFSLSNYSFRPSRSYATPALERDYLRETEAAGLRTPAECHTNQHSIPINLASGSQRFRIAVSMALAIGRYSNRAAHQIESVIIDEGFGSLDKAGRDDMIQELNTLGQQLACIIVVSHQDDFATAFANRYSFKLVDKASYVTLVEGDLIP